MEDQFVHKRIEQQMKDKTVKPFDAILSEESGCEEIGLDTQDFSTRMKEKIEHFVGNIKETPKWLRDNRYIRSGYRVNFNTPLKVLKSLFMLHNEFVNVWTHLGGALVLIVVFTFVAWNYTGPNAVKDFVSREISEYFEPLYQKMPDFSGFDFNIHQKFEDTKNEFQNFKSGAISNFEEKIMILSNEIEQIKNEYTQQFFRPELVKEYLSKFKTEVDKLPEYYEEVKSQIGNQFGEEIRAIKDLTSNLKAKIHELETNLIKKADSEDLDWIDIYKYLNHGKIQEVGERSVNDPHHLSRWPILVFLISAITCLLCSSIFHLFFCLNHKANKILQRLDYAGISLLISGSTFPLFVYGFYCEPFLYNLYLTIIGLTCLVVFFVSLGDYIHRPENTKYKAFMYGGLGIFAAFPCIHMGIISLQDRPDSIPLFSSLIFYGLMGVSYLGGLTIYAVKCPERYHPGKFDIWVKRFQGHSHQFWHLCVLSGILMTYFGAFDNYYARKSVACMVN